MKKIFILKYDTIIAQIFYILFERLYYVFKIIQIWLNFKQYLFDIRSPLKQRFNLIIRIIKMSEQRNQQQKHKIKKYLSLLKHAQNAAFVKLVANNLSAELGGIDVQRPDKILKLVHYLNENTLACSDQVIKQREFARLKITETLIQLIVTKFDNPYLRGEDANFRKVCNCIVAGLNAQDDKKMHEKWQDEVRNSRIQSRSKDKIVESPNDDLLDLFKTLSLHDIMGSSKSDGDKKGQEMSCINELAVKYQALVRDSTQILNVIGKKGANGGGNEQEESLTKDQLIEELDRQVFKLSDFIDQKFLDECLAPVTSVAAGSWNQDRKPVQEFIRATQNDDTLIDDVVNMPKNKRQKIEDQAEPKYIVLSPCLSILLNFTNMLTHDTWEIRQAASCGLACFLDYMLQLAKYRGNKSLAEAPFAYAIVERAVNGRKLDGQEYRIKAPQQQLSFDVLLSNILPRVVIQMLKDQFCDYEDINVLTPVRAQGVKIIEKICQIAQISNQSECQIHNDVQLLIQNLPQLLIACESEWQAKLSFFMIIKGIVAASGGAEMDGSYPPLKEQIFQMFAKEMLIESVLRVEDSVKIVVTELLLSFLDNYFELDGAKGGKKKGGYIDQILNNLSETLKLTDDVEGSVIYVFNLINSILNHSSFDPWKSSFTFHQDVFFPFNFHRVVKVRTTFNLLISKFLNLAEGFFHADQLSTLHTLTVQSLIMEEAVGLRQVLAGNLKSIVKQLSQSQNAREKSAKQQSYVGYLNSYLLTPQRFQEWLYSYEMPISTFEEGFLFIESPCFESVGSNYYVLIYQPVSADEKHAAYINKIEKCVEILAIIASNADLEQYISQFLKMNTIPGAIGQKDVLEYLVYEKLGRLRQNTQFLQSINSEFSQKIKTLDISKTDITDFKDLQKLEQVIEQAVKRMRKHNQSAIVNRLQEAEAILAQAKEAICNPEQAAQPYVLDLAGFRGHLGQAISMAGAIPNLSNTGVICIEDLQGYMDSFIGNQQLIFDRYKALVVSQHLSTYCHSSAADSVALHSTLNNIIHPLWNETRQDPERYYQKVFARVIANDLLPALKKANKVKPLDAVIGLVRNCLAKLSKIQPVEAYDGLNYQFEKTEKPTEENGIGQQEEAIQTANLEVRGSELVLQEWVINEGVGVFDVYGSAAVRKFIRDSQLVAQNGSLDKLQPYINVSYKILQNLILNRKARDKTKAIEQSYIENLTAIMNNLPLIFQGSQMSPDLTFVADMFCSLFYLLSLENSLNTSKTKQWASLQMDLMMTLSEAMEKRRSQQAFIALKCLLEKCLSSQPHAASPGEHENERLARICGQHASDILAYIQLFLLPVIRNLQHSREIFRGDEKQMMVILSYLIQLLPLCQNLAIDQSLFQQKFGEQLTDGQEFLNVFTQNNMGKEEYQFLIRPNAELRDYQKQGILWMSKLGRYGLNCALCDDMGLGKTIQSLTVVLNESRIRQNASNGQKPINLVICPNTLTYQWLKEVEKFFGNEVICAVYDHSNKSLMQRRSGSDSLQTQLSNSNIDIIITSYERARSDIQNLKQLQFFYLVLDEGHRIKNAKSKVTECVKELMAERKLVLSGTPLQNKVSELWSIFDFLMPSFLEEEKAFNKQYNKFLTTNLNRLSEKLEDTQNFIEALKSLKKRIAPFILRRTKQEVLKDLPPKVIQDFECEMPEAQRTIHEYIERTYPIEQVTKSIETDDEAAAGQRTTQKTKGSQILQNLILHRKVCNHPLLVRGHITPGLNALLSQNKQQKVQNNTMKQYQSNNILENSGKLLGFVDLLKQCSIIEGDQGNDSEDGDATGETKPKTRGRKPKDQAGGMSGEQYEGLINLAEDDELGGEDVEKQAKMEKQQTNQHRALVFCQMRTFVDLVVDAVLIPFGIKYTQLQSSHSPVQRFEIVEKFNTDASIALMIMTTSVGGLGLNLTGADTVIFLEHDYNPMKDLQAIDRAHRIGQTRTVNVYRLIMRDSLEQKIMSLQRFKKNLAKNLIQSSRADMSIQDAENMQMHDLLSCFEEHTVYNETTANKKKKVSDNIGAESYEDKVIESTCGAEIWNQKLDDM